MAKFFLRTQKTDGYATLYITVQKRSPKVSLRFVATGISVDVQAWNKANRSVQAWNRFAATEEGQELVKKLSVVTQTIDRLFMEGLINGNEDKDVIEEALREISTAEAIMMQEEIQRIKKDELDRERRNIISFYEYFMKGIKEGSIRYGNGNRYTSGTVDVWKDFGTYLLDFCEKSMTFDDITKSFADRFMTYLEDSGLMAATINKHIARFKKLCNQAAEEGLNSNAVSLKVWKMKTVKTSDRKTEIYLNEEELDALYKMKLDGKREQVRDVFFIGYLSSQRVSDYSNLTIDNFKHTPGGIDTICITQKKTGNQVEVPVWDDRFRELLSKYHNRLPKLRRWDVNDNIKIILHELAKTVPSLNSRYVTPLSLPERRKERRYEELCEKRRHHIKMSNSERTQFYLLRKYAEEVGGSPLYARNKKGQVLKPKYELVSSHTARRSAITNLYKSGILDTREMMSISGHRDEKVFEEYIRVGVSEQAQRVGEKLMKAKIVQLKKAE